MRSRSGQIQAACAPLPSVHARAVPPPPPEPSPARPPQPGARCDPLAARCRPSGRPPSERRSDSPATPAAQAPVRRPDSRELKCPLRTRARGASIERWRISCGNSAGAMKGNSWMPAMASRTPNTPPRSASRRFSVSSCRTSRLRPAPVAARNANSFCLAAPEASSRLATLAQPMSSTKLTVPSRKAKGVRRIAKHPVADRHHRAPDVVKLLALAPAALVGSPAESLRFCGLG